ncbi:uncharacterized protein LOC127754334 isoform X2 [Oryza glaberrima]|uniref:uncharacterized protein LOC127754334 isoform X2 n=1 Tax=Oryza glaberrima TaxID=4538 RepID=UPI00224C1211|nr:uncharacterized protein LOC127754334 isoform X2 [Oryza glaberrima]
MALAGFFDLSILPDDSKSTTTNTSIVARALDLGYSAVALDHPHRGLLADSHAPIASSLLLPPSASLHHRRHPFLQYTRITLSLDSAAACTSALAPSAARLLRTYDIVAARPLTQAAFDHLCQATFDHLDIVSIDFSHKLPFRLKLPMLKLALQRGLHLEIAYSPLIADAASRRQAVAEAKLLVEWTKGKNLIISSAAHTASEIRGPYDAINLSSYLLGLSTQRAKAALSGNCRSLISKALRKKHFYKKTIRIDRLLPNKQLNSANFKLADWIGWDPMPHEVDLLSLDVNPEPSSDKYELLSYKGEPQSLDINPEPSANKDELLYLPINALTEASSHVPYDGDESLFVEQQEQLSHGNEILFPVETQEGPVQVSRGESLMTCVLSTLPASCEQHSVATNLDNPGNNETVMAHDVQTAAVSSFDLKGIEKHVESLHDAMELDGTESSKMNLIADFTAPLSSDDSLVCYAIPCSMELSDTSVVNKCPHQSTGFPDYAKACTECDSGLTSCERVDRISQDHDILSGSSIYSKNKDLYSYSDISVFSETHKDFAEPLELPPCGKDDEAPPDLAAQLHCNSCKDVMMPPQVISDEVEPVDRGATILVEHTPCGPETALTAFLYDKGSIDTTSKTDELAKQNSNSLEGDVAKIHEQLLNYSYASGEVEISLTRSEKRTKKLRSQHPIYVPFLGFLKSVSFKKKASKVWFFEDTAKHEFLVCYQCDMNNEKQELVLDFFLYCIDRDIVA